MRNRFKLFSLLLVLMLGFVLVSCKDDEDPTDETPTSFNALGTWADGGDAVYTISTNTADSLAFTYDKGESTYGFMKTDITADLSSYKKLVITLEGSGTILVKLETNDETPAKEIGLNVTGISGSYEWNLIADSAFLAKVDQIVIIAAPGKINSVGNVTITEMEFYEDVAANYIIQTGFNNIPQNVNEYDGTGDTFDFNDKWESNDPGVFEITYVAEEAVVTFDKAATFSWAYMKTMVQGDFTDFNYVVFIVSGTAGQKLLIKANEYNDYEQFVWLTGGEQELVLDLTEMPLAEKNAITDFKVFAAAGVAPATGTFTLHEAYFAEDYDYTPPVVINNVYESGDTFALEYWYDGGDLDYTITKDGTDVLVSYTKKGEWTNMNAPIEGDLSVFDKVVIEVTGQDTKVVKFKVEGTSNIEQDVTFDGTRQTVEIDITTMTIAQRAAINKFVVFGAPGSAIGSGEFTIHSVTFAKAGPIVYEGYDFLDGWVENDLGTYAFSTVEEATVVDYTKGVGQEWAFMRRNFAALDAEGYNALVMTFDGEAGKTVLVKPNDNSLLEETVTFGDEPVTIIVYAESFTSVLIFAEPNTASVSGQFTISVAVLTFIDVEVEDPEWVGYGLTVLETETDVTITYVDTPANWWENNAQLAVVDFDGTKEKVSFTFIGVNGQEYVFKIEGGGVNKEETVMADGTLQTFVLDLSTMTEVQRDGLNLIVIFSKTPGASGSLVVNNWEYVVEWIGYGMTVVNTETDVTITYADTPAEWWNSNAQLEVFNFDGTKEQIKFTFTGVTGHEYLFKIEGGGQARELPIIGDGTEQELILPLTTMTLEQRNALNLIIVFVKTTGASGSVVVKNWEYVEGEAAAPVWVGYGLTVLETETDVTITYANTPANWWENNAQLAVVDFDGTKDAIVFTFTGVNGQEYVFKIEGGGVNKEETVMADGTLQTFVLDLSTMTEAQRDGLNLIVIFSKTAGASGSLVVNDWAYPILD